ncbi:hypothetical protein [Diaminobutyricibacter sp. McL0608]|uniref:hypothetical protein n=1 Tax=Leifsonia sp. McL0608 TaxID=3143537 RepID=UPI0031F336F5
MLSRAARPQQSSVRLQVDGGINESTIAIAAAAGADALGGPFIDLPRDRSSTSQRCTTRLAPNGTKVIRHIPSTKQHLGATCS